jgi:hypothetical protein
MFINKKNNLIMIIISVLFLGYLSTTVALSDIVPPLPIGVNNAQFISQSIPTIMNAGQTYQVSVTIKNIGTTTWNKGSFYRLGSQNPANNATWGNAIYYSLSWPEISRIELADSEQVLPGATKTFSFNVKAPSLLGNYNFQWKMVQDGLEWFGDLTPNMSISVVATNLLDLSIEPKRVFPVGYDWGTGVTLANISGSAENELIVGACKSYDSGQFIGKVLGYLPTNSIVWGHTSPSQWYVGGIDAGDINDNGDDEVVIGYLSPLTSSVAEAVTKDGNVLWSYIYPNGMIRAVRIGELSSISGKEVLLAGGGNSGGGEIILLNSSGGEIWKKEYECQGFRCKLQAARIADVNADGINEIIVVGGWGEYGNVRLMDRNGNELWKVNVGEDTLGVGVNDLSSNPGLEIAVVSGERIGSGGYNRITLLNANGSIAWQKSLTVPAWSVAVGDINLDGKNEIFVGYGTHDAGLTTNDFGGVMVFNNVGEFMANASLPSSVKFIEFGDANGDGKKDIVASCDCGGAYVISSKTQLTPNPTCTLSANPSSVTPGSSSILSWISSNATNCSASWTTSTSISGIKSVSPLSSTTYNMTCIGTGGSGNCSKVITVITPTPTPTPTPTFSPTVNLLADNSDGPITIIYNTSTNLSWTSSNVTSCTASNGWSGTKLISGSVSTGNLVSSKTYTITCAGTGGSTSDSVIVNLSSALNPTPTPTSTPLPSVTPTPSASPNAPTVFMTSSKSSISAGETIAIIWSSVNVSYCTASGNWSGAKETSGLESVNPTQTSIYTLTCSGSKGSHNQSLTIKVGDSDAIVNSPTPTPSITPTLTPVMIPTLPTNPTQADYQNLLDALLKQLAFLQEQLSTQQRSSNYQFTHNLQLGDSGEDVTQLQILLKAQGKDIYPEGLVSGYFGNLTKLAIQRFQKKYGIASSGNEWTTGYGMVGPKTRLKLNELL